MSTASVSNFGLSGYNREKLYWLSVIALFAAGMSFAVRAGVTADMRGFYFSDASVAANAEQLITGVLSWAFLGFAIGVLIGSPLCDTVGMGRLMWVACACFIGGVLLNVATPVGAGANMQLTLGMALLGIAHGLVEAVINPLIATLYPDEKTHRLNVLHSWWPGGIIAGSAVSLLPVSWQVKLGLIILPSIIFGVMLIGSKFPPTERVAAGVSSTEMFMEAFKPLFIVLFFCMLLTASTELAPGAWVDSALTRTVGMRGIWLTAYVAGLMFVMRYFAGPLAHKLSPIGLLWFSSLLAGAGLLLLARANSPVTGILAATVWGVGVCYMWPTMLAVTSERFPRGGAFLMGIMGSAGNLAIYFALPALGAMFDNAKIEKAGGKEAFETLSANAKAGAAGAETQLNQVLQYASEHAFQMIAILPGVLLLVFGAIWLYDRSRGGYQAEALVSDEKLSGGVEASVQ